MPKPKNLSPKKPKKSNGAAKLSDEQLAHLDADTSPGAVKQGVRNFVVASKRPVFLHEIGAALDYATAEQIDEAITSLSDGETPTLFVCLDRRLGLVGRDDQDVLETAEDEDDLDDEDTDDDDSPPSSPETVTTRYLSCQLSPEKIEALRLERESQDTEIEELQKECDQHFEEGRALKKKIDALYEEGLAKSKRIRNGAEMRDVPCEDRKEPDPREDSPTKGEVIRITYRLDTNEAIEWRPLTRADLQGQLFGDIAAPTPRDGGVVVREPDAIESAPLPTETGAEIAEDLFA